MQKAISGRNWKNLVWKLVVCKVITIKLSDIECFCVTCNDDKLACVLYISDAATPTPLTVAFRTDHMIAPAYFLRPATARAKHGIVCKPFRCEGIRWDLLISNNGQVICASYGWMGCGAAAET